MRKKIYYLSLALILLLPILAIGMALRLDPSQLNFPGDIRWLLIIAAVFIVVLNQLIDYHKDNKNRIRFLFTFFSLLPVIPVSLFPIRFIILEASDYLIFSFMISLGTLLINHSGVLAKSPSHLFGKLTFIFTLVAIVLSVLFAFYPNNSLFNGILLLIGLSFLSSLRMIIDKKSPDFK